MGEGTDEHKMWGHIIVEAENNPTYAIAYAILVLADKVEDLANALEAGCDKITSAIDDISSTMAHPPDKA
jgi:hypothetical protein